LGRAGGGGRGGAPPGGGGGHHPGSRAPRPPRWVVGGGAPAPAGAHPGAPPRHTFHLTAGRRRADGTALRADPAPLLAAVVEDVRRGTPTAVVAARFHHAVARLVRTVCAVAREETGLRTVALTGGVFANTVLSSACARGLRADGFTVLRHREIPPGDGGLALGQLVVAARAAAINQ
ncbi:hypothetical protein ACFWR9_01080, partial [Streptomyces sp. NPDC058534]